MRRDFAAGPVPRPAETETEKAQAAEEAEKEYLKMAYYDTQVLEALREIAKELKRIRELIEKTEGKK